MSKITLDVAEKEAAVLLTVLASVPMLLIWQTFIIIYARRAARLRYPQHYPTIEQCEKSIDMRRLACALRCNANTLELLPMFVISLLISSLRFPRVAAALGVLTMLSSVTYTLGYTSKEAIPIRRYRNPFGHVRNLAMPSLAFMSVYTALEKVYVAFR